MPVYVPIVADSRTRQLALPGAAVMGETAVHNAEHALTLTGTYGLQGDLVETFSATGGVIGTNEARQIDATTTTSVGSHAVARTRRALRWRPGTSLSWAASCAFPVAGVPLSVLQVGNVSQSSATYVGYNGATFGFHRQYAGGGELQRLTLSASAVGAENATITLNGVAYVVPLTAGSPSLNAAEIAAFAGWAATWQAFQVDNTVVFQAINSGVMAGAFTMTSASAAGTFAQVDAGQANATESFAQSAWNVDVCDGTGSASNPSGFNLNPAQLNQYRCVYTWELAAFYVYNPATLDWILVHVYTGLNADRTQLVVDPTMQLGVAAASLGSTTALEIICAWVSGESDADYPPARNPRGAVGQQTSLATGSVVPLLTIRNGLTLDGHLNQAAIEPYIISVYNGSGKDAIVRLRLNASLTGAVYTAEDADSCADVDTAATASSGGTVVGTFVVVSGASETFNIEQLAIILDREETMTVDVFVASGAAYDATASMTWRERV